MVCNYYSEDGQGEGFVKYSHCIFLIESEDLLLDLGYVWEATSMSCEGTCNIWNTLRQMKQLLLSCRKFLGLSHNLNILTSATVSTEFGLYQPKEDFVINLS